MKQWGRQKLGHHPRDALDAREGSGVEIKCVAIKMEAMQVYIYRGPRS